MGYILRLSFLLALCTGAACAVVTLVGTSTGQAQQSSTGVVQPAPLSPTPLISSQNATACLVGCDTQAMNCQNACVIVGANATSTVNPPPSGPCNLSCTTQQLVCKQACTRQ
jgi:hypothetical protein